MGDTVRQGDRQGGTGRVRRPGGSSSRSNAMELGSMSGGQNTPCVFSAFYSREHEKVHIRLLSVFFHTRAPTCVRTNEWLRPLHKWLVQYDNMTVTGVRLETS